MKKQTLTDEERRRRAAEAQKRWRSKNRRQYLETQIACLTRQLQRLDEEEAKG